MLPNFWCILGHCLIETHTSWQHFLFGMMQYEPLMFLYVFKLSHNHLVCGKIGPSEQYEEPPPPSPHRDDLTPCSTVLTVHCEFSVWWSSDKLSEDPRPKKNNFVSSADKMLCYFSLGQSLWLFWQIVTCPAKVIFFPQWVLQGLLTDSLSSHRSFFLVVAVLRGLFRPCLITQEQSVRQVFSIWAIIEYIQMIIFHILPCYSGFGCHFEAFQIIPYFPQSLWCRCYNNVICSVPNANFKSIMMIFKL